MKYDLAIVGSGPAGLAAASHAQANGLSYLLLERADHLSDTIYAYQARKFVMSEPVMIPAAAICRSRPARANRSSTPGSNTPARKS